MNTRAIHLRLWAGLWTWDYLPFNGGGSWEQIEQARDWCAAMNRRAA